jgi:AraC-like DNA-binding protein
MPALTRELILEASTFGAHYRPDSAESRLISVLCDRLRLMPAAKVSVPLPVDLRARRLCEALLADPADDRNLEEWGRQLGASSRTLARLFQRETGLGFDTWRQRLRLSCALDRMELGESITHIALDLGYSSPSAFSAMFRRVLGAPPSRYAR